MSAIRLQWTPPGPVAAAFMRSRAEMVGIMGPIGSGKTSAVVNKILKIASEQAPSPIDGVARTKWVAIRDTYRQLHKTTIPTWRQWVPLPGWSGGENDGPASHDIVFQVPGPRGMKRVELRVEFVALGDRSIEDVARGYEITGFWLNEADLVTRDAVTYLPGRLRYPSQVEGGPTWKGGLCDFNAPDTESWCFDLFVENRPEGWEFYRQPSGFSPQAENLHNLPAGYYETAAKGQSDWYVRRMIRNEFGYSRDGKPVYGEFSDALHISAEPLAPLRGVKLRLGFDQGLNPAAVIGQRDSFGQRRILDELCLENVGAERFSRELLALLGERYPGFDVDCGWADPAAGARAAQAREDEQTWRDVVAAKTGIAIRLAPTNGILARTEAVRQQLTRTLDGGRPAILVSSRCKVLRRGFNSLYRYKRVRSGSGETFHDEPEKNFEANVHDALQYLELGDTGYGGLMRRAEEQRARSMAPAITTWDPFG
ncbi:hypothetical protein [Zavarzinia sp. CC-PAN008]|uniref:hypothetical protein n=1 Tax=Zavarzinia sp. CC-PAN008 TaxID=3243332 RepID=UPI003F748A28